MKYFIIILCLVMAGCASVPRYDNYIGYEECNNSAGFYLYATDDTTSQPILYVPANNAFYTRTAHRHKYIKLYYGSHHGYAYNRHFKFKKVWNLSMPADLVVQQDNNYAIWLKDYRPDNVVSAPARTTSSSTGSSGGSVHVNGYYRKNGTYVRPYTRSAPSRRH
ncbi:hypothetical protein [Chitinophaga sp.]|uniref:hypothetical protein n=1 Tax=Chitinophaga sp. TaxID=1869181 RepID=UPI0031D7B671